MKEVTEAIKYAGGVFSALVVCATFITTLCKPIRKWIVNKIREITQSEDADKTLKETNRLLKEHIASETEWKKKLEEQLLAQQQTDIIQLRNTINHIYEKNLNTKTISIREKQNLADMFTQYRKLGGNHYIEQIYGEMMHWETYSN